MRIVSCTLTRLRIPFRNAFSHAAAARHHSDAIIVAITTDEGITGFGEIQARPYVTGENNDTIWQQHAPAIAQALIGQQIRSVGDIASVLTTAGACTLQPACRGGFDIALHDALDVAGYVDWNALFGTRTTAASGKCMTIGDDHDDKALVRQGRFARLSRCTIVKLKVKDASDAARIQLLRETIGPDMQLRLDGNGQMTLDNALQLLSECHDCDIQSIEEPLPQSESLTQALQSLHDTSGVPIVADESVCVAGDLVQFADHSAYQIINVRVGKCGGVTGCAELTKTALDHGFGIVCGTMVGESAVLLRISGKMLHHCAALDYVEGLDQTQTLLEAQAIERAHDLTGQHFCWHDEHLARYQTGRMHFD